MNDMPSFWWLTTPALLGFLVAPVLHRILSRKAFLTLEEDDGKARLIVENTAGEELQSIRIKVVLPQGLSVERIREKSEGQVRVENGSVVWHLDTLGRHQRKLLEFSMSDSSVKDDASIEFMSEPSTDESYHFDRHRLQWKIYSSQAHRVRTLLYRMSEGNSSASEFAWKIQV